MKEYEINSETMALIPENDQTLVYELHDMFKVDNSVNKIMEHSCNYFGSSLSGRQKGTANLIGVTHKAPIIIEESTSLIFFPTMSPRLTQCMWLNLAHVRRYYRENLLLIVEFNNGQKIPLKISYGSLENQILRATRLEAVLRQRKNMKMPNFI